MALSLGLNFGSKKQSSTGTSFIDKTTQTDLNQDQSTNTSKTSVGNTSGVNNTQSQQNGTQVGSQNQQQTGRQTGAQTGTVTTLGQDIQDSIGAKVQEILGGGINSQNINMISNMITGRGGFDADSFVQNTVGVARNRGEQTLQEQNSAFGARAGGTASTNSMAALMAQRGRNDLETTLAGIEASSRATAEGISNDNLKTAVGAQGGVAEIASGLAGTLKGATTTTDMQTLQDEISNLLGSNTTQNSQTANSTNQTQTFTSQSDLMQEIANLISLGTAREVGNETQTMKGKSKGMGFSLGI